MTHKSWRKMLHKFVIFSGFMALTAMAASEAGRVDREPNSLAESLIKPRIEVKIPLLAERCPESNWLEHILKGSKARMCEPSTQIQNRY